MIIIVAGLPGSGKSYFAVKLADTLGAIYINSDKIRKKMNSQGRYSLEDKLLVYREMSKISFEFIAEGEKVVVDATFWLQSMRDLFITKARKSPTVIAVILVEADEDLIKERLNRPREDSEADFDVYKKVREEFEEIKIPHLKLHSTNDNISSLLRKALNYINSIDGGK